jgi:hypothetical protein
MTMKRVDRSLATARVFRDLRRWCLLAAMVAGCAGSPAAGSSSAIPPESPSATSSAAPVATASLPPTTTASPRPALVGQWELDRTCQAIVAALTKAGHPELIRGGVGELVKGNINGVVPSDWDSKHPCATALPPTLHSHTFWPNGMFNSYDEHGNQVDDGPWAIIDDQTFTIGASTFAYLIMGDALLFEPIVPADCRGQCRDDLGWMYSVSFPGSAWHRVTTGPHVP